MSDLILLEIAKEVQALKLKENLTIEAALKRISIEYSRGIKENGGKKDVFKNYN